MRIASLVPSSTEMLFALGLGDSVVGVTHECDWPSEATALPHLTRSVIAPGLGPAEIDARVRESVAAGHPLYELDADAFEQLRPDLIVAQELCAVCAVSYDQVCDVAASLPGGPPTISLDPTTLDEVLGDVLKLGEATARPDLAARLHADLGEGIARVRELTGALERPRVVALEWLDPPFSAGHWVPEMVDLAGGAEQLGRAGERSRTVEWDEVAAARPEVVVLMQCGYTAAQCAAEGKRYADRLSSLGARAIWAVDAAASFSRPGPRLVDGIELLGHLLHPGSVPDPGTVEAIRVAA